VSGFDYFRQSGPRYLPATSAAARRSLEQGLLPPEAWLHLSVSVKPLDEEPLDLEMLDRVLAREDLDLSTCLILRDIFARLAQSPDPEAALLAAESLNLLENRYIRRIDSLRRETEGGANPASLERLAGLLYELALLSPAGMRNFYLREAYGCLRQLGAVRRLSLDALGLAIRVLLELGLHEQAARVFARLRAEDQPHFLLLAAEVAYRRRDYTEVRRLLGELARRPEAQEESVRDVLAAWLEG
jgi:hypothetical protein